MVFEIKNTGVFFWNRNPIENDAPKKDTKEGFFGCFLSVWIFLGIYTILRQTMQIYPQCVGRGETCVCNPPDHRTCVWLAFAIHQTIRPAFVLCLCVCGRYFLCGGWKGDKGFQQEQKRNNLQISFLVLLYLPNISGPFLT